jgi:hypothetical protein
MLGPESNPAVQGCLPQRLREGLTRWQEGHFQPGLHHLEEKKAPESLRSVEAIKLTFCGQKDSIRENFCLLMKQWRNLQKFFLMFFQQKCQCCGSGMFIPDPRSRYRLFSIPDPSCLHPGSRILIKEFKYFNPKKPKKWFLSSKKYDLGCSSRIPDPDADFLPIPDPGVKKAPDPGSGSATLKNVIFCDMS